MKKGSTVAFGLLADEMEHLDEVLHLAADNLVVVCDIFDIWQIEEDIFCSWWRMEGE